MGAKVYGGPKWTVSPVYEGMLKEELDAAAERHPDVQYQPILIDATYAGLISGVADMPLVIPALNRDGDCLSDLVMPMFGSIAGAESVLLAFDDDHEIDVAMAEAPHGTAPALQGKDVANPMAMILACGAVLHYAGRRGAEGAEHGLAGDLRERARGDRRRRAHAGPRRLVRDDGVHRRRRPADSDEARGVVVAGLVALTPAVARHGLLAVAAGARCAGGGRTAAGSRASACPRAGSPTTLSASCACEPRQASQSRVDERDADVRGGAGSSSPRRARR